MTPTYQRAIPACCLAAAAALLLAGCAETQLTAHALKEVGSLSSTPLRKGVYKVGEPYQVNGVWYYPREDPRYDKSGIGSWYGTEFHGRPTANGDIYDMNALTAAHPTLPMTSRVHVTNLENGRSLVLVINDRGPFASGRIIDVSRRAAQLLGFAGRGTARLRVQAIAPGTAVLQASAQSAEPAPVRQATAPVRQAAAPVAAAVEQRVMAAVSPRAPAAMAALQLPAEGSMNRSPSPRTMTAGGVFYVRAGVFSRAENATRLVGHLERFGRTEIATVQRDGAYLYRVRIGPITSSRQAEALLYQVIEAGHEDARLEIE